MSSSSRTALQTFSLTNEILEVSQQDEIYRFDVEANKRINREAPWSKECVEFFMLIQASDLMPYQKPPLLQVMQDFCRRTYQDGRLLAFASRHSQLR